MVRKYCAARWDNVNILLQKMAQRNSRNNLISHQEFSPSSNSLASSFLTVALLLWLWKISAEKCKSRVSTQRKFKCSSRYCMETAFDFFKFFISPILYGYIILALISGTEWTSRYKYSETNYVVKEYHVSNLHDLLRNFLSVVLNYCYMNTLAWSSRSQILIILLLHKYANIGGTGLRQKKDVASHCNGKPSLNYSISYHHDWKNMPTKLRCKILKCSIRTANVNAIKGTKPWYCIVQYNARKTDTCLQYHKWKDWLITIRVKLHYCCNYAINWIFVKLLLLCGDVEVNPGPITLADKLDLQLLQLVKWHGKGGEERKLRICEELASDWEKIAEIVGLSTSQKRVVEDQQIVTDRITKLFEIWINNDSNLSSEYLCTWKGLCTLLSDIGKVSMQRDIENNIKYWNQISKEFSAEVDTTIKPLLYEPTVYPEFSLKRLTLLKWTDKDGQTHILRLRDDMSSKWHDVGDMLDLTTSRMDSILSHRLGDARQCCRDVLQEWITNGSQDYSATWEGLLSLLEDLALNDLAISLRTALDGKEFSAEVDTTIKPLLYEPTVYPEFSLRRLALLKWTDKDGQTHILRLRDDMSSKWRDVGDMLDLTTSRLDGIWTLRLGDDRQCCRDVLQEWITNGSPDYSATWEGLLSLLEDLALNDLAISLRTALDGFGYETNEIRRYPLTNEIPRYPLKEEQKLILLHRPGVKDPSTDYTPYLEKIEFIILVVGEKEYRAAICNIQQPCGKGFEKMKVVSLENNLIVGSLADSPILIVKSENVNSISDDLERALHCCLKAKYILSVGIGYCFQTQDMKLGDVFVSSSISHAEHYSVNKQGNTASIDIEETSISISDFLTRIFCNNLELMEDFYISKVRKAVYYSSNVISGIDVNEAGLNNATKITIQPHAIGGDLYVPELIRLQESKKISGFILIKSVTSYANGNHYSEWDFTGAMSAFHYVKEKMTPYIKHKRAVENYLESTKSSENVVDVAVAKVICLGPSMQGKTVTRKRLTNTITNIISDTNADKSNTGISEQTTVVCGKLHRSTILAAEEEDNWEVIENIEQEVEMYIRAKPAQKPLGNSNPTQNHGDITEKHTPEERPKSKVSEPSSRLHIESTELHNSSTSKPPRTETNSLSHTAANLSIDSVQVSAENVSYFLQRKKTYNLSELKVHLDKGCMIYLQDTGGQPELMDCLPALTIGPALYLLFCKLNTNLDDYYKIGYRGTDGEASSLLSNFTIKQTLLSALVSISSMLYSSSDDASDIEQQTKNRKQCVYIVGTHRDKVKNDSIDKFEMNFQELVRPTFFYKNGLIKEWCRADFPSNSTLRNISNRLVYPLDNEKGDSEEISCLRRALQAKINQYAKRAIPSQWLVFSIVLRGRPEVILTLQTCFIIGKHLNMNNEQTEAALHFLHYNLGICMHFANVKGLEQVVISNTQAIYQSLTLIIEAAFKPGIVNDAAASVLKHTGKFSLEAFSSEIETPVQLDKLVLILEHLNIIARIVSTNKEETIYFMPCILPNASDKEIESFEEQNKMPHEVSPLYIRYDCGFVPMGVFPAMVANLIQQDSKKGCEHIRLKDDLMKRNYIQFSYGEDRDILTFIHHSEYIKILLSRDSDCELELHELCPKIVRLIKTTISSVSGSMLHSLYTDISKDQYKHYFENYCFAFKCYQHPESDHLCTISNNDKNPRRMDCVKGNASPKMKPEHQVWYGKEIIVSSCKTGTEFSMKNLRLLGTPETEELRLIETISPKWEEASELLGMRNDRIKIIKANNLWNGVEACCSTVMNHWLDDSIPRYNYTRSWKGMCQLLTDLQMAEVAKSLSDIVFK